MPVQSPTRILDEVRRLGLVSAAGALVLGADADTTPDRLGDLLLEAGLTPFQLQTVLVGQADHLAFGPYIILDRLGEGGMGVVYKARHVKLGRIDALKVLRPDKAGSKTIARRFRREIELTSSLAHAHIVRAYDAGVVGRQLWLATEYVAGTDLGTLVLRRGPLSLADACLAVYQTALALRHIHERGLVHRDLKPSNLIRDHATGSVKLLDLGLSGFHRPGGIGPASGNLTRDGVLLGTPDFMAPEQVENAHGVDIRADMYSLGCTFYFLLTGRAPYDGSQVETLIKHTAAPPPPLVLPAGAAPPGVAAVIARLMAKKPADRFQTPLELTDALLALRPGAEGVMEQHAGMLSVTPLPPSADSSGAFAHLLSSVGATDNPPRSVLNVSRPRRRWGQWVVVVAVLVLLGALAGVVLQQKGKVTPTPSGGKAVRDAVR